LLYRRPCRNRKAASLRKITMPKLYSDIDINLCTRAVAECFQGKWTRNDILTFIEEWAGIDRVSLRKEALDGSCLLKAEAMDVIGTELMDVVEAVERGENLGDLIAPVIIDERVDGRSGKIRKIATLDIWHQLLGHVVKLSIEKLLNARILPTQHASIPGHGQTRLKDQARRYLHRDSLQIKCIQKTDVRHAYGTTMYSRVIGIIRREIPRAKRTLRVMEFLGTLAPEGHLIIGGYLDAWLFNFVMSYALRAVLSSGHERRGKVTYYVSRVESYMDDFGIMAPTKSGLRKAVKQLSQWLAKNLGLDLKLSTGIILLLPTEAEEGRKKEQKASRRACPGLDMAGYIIHRTYTTIRGRVFVSARRQWLRAWRELQSTGTLRLVRAQKIIAYNGYIVQSNSYKLKRKYHTSTLLAIAKAVTAFYGSQDSKRRRERVYAQFERYERYKAGFGAA